jgi:hypothetical protein
MPYEEGVVERIMQMKPISKTKEGILSNRDQYQYGEETFFRIK